MQTKNKQNKTDELNIADLFMFLLSKWPWFLLSIILCVGLAWFYYARTPFVYFRTATVTNSFRCHQPSPFLSP